MDVHSLLLSYLQRGSFPKSWRGGPGALPVEQDLAHLTAPAAHRNVGSGGAFEDRAQPSSRLHMQPRQDRADDFFHPHF